MTLIALIAIILAGIVLALICLIPAFILMVILGALSSIFAAPALAIGFGTSLLITFLLAIFL